jgi:hypothetical protein
MKRSLIALFTFVAFSTTSLLVAPGAFAGDPDISDLVQKLSGGGDFRVRVQAALQLGKLKESKALEPLIKALDDKEASVRAAAAAALKTLGDKRAVEPLREHRLDRSDAVRAQILASITALTAEERKKTAKVFVKLGSIRNGSDTESIAVKAAVETSRAKLNELPEVWVLDENEDAEGESKTRKVPLVLVTGRIQKLNVSKQGSEIVYSAQVEYVVHRMPEQAIAGKVSGSASATLTESEAKDKDKRAELRRTVLEAAVASALRRASQALLAAAKM